MTGRERLLRAFRKESVDRMPVSPFIHGNFVRFYAQDPQAELIANTVQIYKRFGFDIMHREANISFGEELLDSENWRVSTSEEVRGNDTLVTTTITTPERVLRSVDRRERLSPYQTVRAVQEWFIKDEEDFRQFQKYQPPVPPFDLTELRESKRLVGEDGIIAPWFRGGVFNYLSGFRKLDDLLMDAIVDSTFYHEMMTFFQNRLMQGLAPVLEEGVDVLSYGGNIANGSLVGPRYFEEYVMPYEIDLIRYIQHHGTMVLYHNCGDAANMIGLYNQMGIDAFESMTEPPYADMSLVQSVREFDPSITLIGNVDQISFLKTATPQQVKELVWKKMEIVGNRKGFVMGTSDFLEEGTPYENIEALTEAVLTYQR